MILVPCPACRRHVRRSEPACPFCHATLGSSTSIPERVRAPRRRSRAALYALAVASAGSTACGGVTSEASQGRPQQGAGGAGSGGARGDGGSVVMTGGAPGTGGEPRIVVQPSTGGTTSSPDAGKDAGRDANWCDYNQCGIYNGPPPPRRAPDGRGGFVFYFERRDEDSDLVEDDEAD